MKPSIRLRQAARLAGLRLGRLVLPAIAASVLSVFALLAIGPRASLAQEPPTVSVTVKETFGVADAKRLVPDVFLAVRETFGVADTNQLSPDLLVSVQETFGVADSNQLSPDVLVAVRETFGVAETNQLLLDVFVTVQETFGVADTNQFLLEVFLKVQETFGVADTNQLLPDVFLAFQETFGVADTNQLLPDVFLAFRETFGVAETNQLLPDVFLAFRETFGVADSIQLLPDLFLAVRETFGVADSIQLLPDLFLAVQETFGVTDTNLLLLDVFLVVQETFGFADISNFPLVICGQVITADTTIDQDLTDCSGTGLEIQGDNITLDCAGHTIAGDGTGIGNVVRGILVRGANNRVENCNVTGFYYGLDIAPTGGFIDGNVFFGNTVGAISQASGVTWSNNAFRDNLEIGAHTISTGTGNIFVNNTATGNGFDPVLGRPSDGFHIAGDGARLTGNTANNNFRKGIAIVGADNVIVGGENPADGNTANNNQRYGIYLQTANGNTVSNNTATGNFFGGIRLQSTSTGNEISNNQVFDNGLNPCCRPGIQPAGVADANNEILNNDVGNNGIGIQIPGSTDVIGNTVRDNHKDGILVDGELNTIDGNEIFNNTTTVVDGSRAGLNLRSANDNTIINNIIRNNFHWGIELRNGNTFNLFRGNTVIDNVAGGIVFTAGALDHDNTLYNNLFANSLNIGSGATTGPNTWINPAGQTPGTNIIGGPFLGGNFYGNNDGTGFSQTCADRDGDGICDSPLVFNPVNVDQFPLRDNTSPLVTPPADTTAEAEGPAGTPVFTLAAFLATASALDNIDGAVNVTNDAPPVFPLGPTVVTFSATDLTGNGGTATATVIVVDTTPPVVTAPAKLAVAVEVTGKDATGTTPATSAKIAAFLAGATAFDTVDLALVVINDAPKIFPEGTTQVSFRATDLSGNTATAVSSVLVIEDGDGIHPFIDGRFVDSKFIDESLRSSDNFTDQHIAKGSTFGFVVDRQGLVVTVVDLAEGGVLLGAEGADDKAAAVNVCDTLIKLGAGKLVDVACGSLILGVIVGPVEVLNSNETTTVALSTGTTATVSETTDPTTGELTGDLTLQLDETTVVTVPSGTVATVTEIAEGEFLITNDTPPKSGTDPITIQVGGSEDVEIGAGTTYVPVVIDIKPGSDPNSINLGSAGVIPVAILTTSVAAGDLVDFDVADVDQTTLTLSGAVAREKGKSGKIGTFEDVDGDGDMDLVVQFRTAEMNLSEFDTIVVLDGNTFDGSAIHGSGPIVVVPP